jgi:cytosine deaminase
MTRHREVEIPDSGAFVLANARVPRVFLPQEHAGGDRKGDDPALLDVEVGGGVIKRIAAAGAFPAPPQARIDLEGRLVWPTLVDMHAHLDKGQAIPRALPDGTIATGATGTANDRAHWTAEDIARRMNFSLRCAYVHGVSAIRTHIDSNHELTERSWAVFQDVRSQWAGRIALQGVGLAPLDLYLGEDGTKLSDLVARSGGILGGVTDGIGDDWADTSRIDAALDRFLALAAERTLDVDLHVDQSADLSAFALPRIAAAVLRSRFTGRVVCGHCVNLALQPEEVVRRTIALCADAGLAFVTLPTPMMYLMDRVSGRTPRWRGVTLAHELRAAGLRVAIGGDNCRDAWFAYGDHDMVDTFQQAVRVLQLDHPIETAPAMAGPVPAEIIGAAEFGSIAVGAPARLILFNARSMNELMCRPQCDRIVIDRGARVQHALPEYGELD